MKKLALLAGLLLLAPRLGKAEVAQAIGPFGGLNNTDNPLILSGNQAQDLLNVDVTPQGKSVKRRKGYGLQFNLAVTTSPVHGTYAFYDANGSDVSLFFHDRYAQGSVNGATPTTIFSTFTLAATWQCVDSLGFAYCASSARDSIIKTNGVTYSTVASAPLGTIIAVTPERLLVAGTSGTPQRINFSKANDFTTWTVGPAATDPVTEDINAPGSRITHVTYAFNKIIWFKDASFGAILGSDNTNWQIITISPTIGTLDNTSVYRDGVLYFRGQDGHIYAFDGSVPHKLTRDLGNTISLSSARRSNSWTQSSQSDFVLGASSPTPYHVSTSISPGDVIVGSFTFTDTFSGGTFNNTQTSGSTVIISTSNTNFSDNDMESAQWSAAGSGWSGGNSGTTPPGECAGGAKSGSGVADYQSGSASYNVTVSLIDANSGTSYGSTTFAYAANCTWTQRTITVSGASRKYARVEISVSTNKLQSPRFTASGSNITFWTRSNTLAGTQITELDLFELGASTITTGSYTSSTFDTGVNFNYAGMTPTYTVDDGQPAFVLQHSSNNVNWSDLTTSSATTNNAGRRYLRYISTFTFSGSQDSNTSLSSMVIFARSSGTYLSQVKNAPSLTSWDTFTATKQDNGGSHTFYMRSSSNSFTTSSSTPTWTSVTNGAVIGISTGAYFQVRDDFFIDSSSETPTLNDFTVNWFEGSAGDKAYATYHDNAIWWAITSGAGSTSNNYVLRYDLLNQIWTLYDLAINGLHVRNNSLYFGSSSAGKIFKFGDATNDNGSAINSYWKSKDFFGDSPFTEKEYRTLSLSAASVANSTMTVTYTVNGSSSTAYNVYLYDSASSFLKSNKNLPLGRNGSYFNVKFGNNAADQPWEVFGLQFTFEPKPWRPTQ